MAKGELGKVLENWQEAENNMTVTIKNRLKHMANLSTEDLSDSDIDAIAESRAKKCAEMIVENLQQKGYKLKKDD